ncbi:MAG TPA: 16S rRNA (guanine(527)-N(7))-methyltransferase RsmG [Haliangiales bacterium]|nr:16S rRNA (guanine(527)-N(7))-methyltransferase RsmG [Haliangiales bacterium]
MNAQAGNKYVQLLLFWNRRINLTAIRNEVGIRSTHFGDSLAAAAHVPSGAATLVDVGSGAGFPGAVIALSKPELRVTLVEPNHKKAAFLEALRREVPIPNIQIIAHRVDRLAERFDVATSRATFPLPKWLSLGARLVRPGGLVLGFEGAQAAELPPGAQRIPYAPGRSIILYVPRET